MQYNTVQYCVYDPVLLASLFCLSSAVLQTLAVTLSEHEKVQSRLSTSTPLSPSPFPLPPPLRLPVQWELLVTSQPKYYTGIQAKTGKYINVLSVVYHTVLHPLLCCALRHAWWQTPERGFCSVGGELRPCFLFAREFKREALPVLLRHAKEVLGY